MARRLNLHKILKEAHSVKVWLIVVTTVLLVKHFVSDTVWASFIGSLLAMREGSELRHNYYNQTVNTDGPVTVTASLPTGPHYD